MNDIAALRPSARTALTAALTAELAALPASGSAPDQAVVAAAALLPPDHAGALGDVNGTGGAATVLDVLLALLAFNAGRDEPTPLDGVAAALEAFRDALRRHPDPNAAAPAGLGEVYAALLAEGSAQAPLLAGLAVPADHGTVGDARVTCALTAALLRRISAERQEPDGSRS